MKSVTVAIALLCTPIMYFQVFAQVASEGSEQGTSPCIPAPVSNLQVQPGPTSLAVTWTKPETECPGGKTEVVVRWAVGEKKTSKRFEATVENYEVQDLQPWTTVMLKVFIQHTDNNNLTHDSSKAEETVTTLKKKCNHDKDASNDTRQRISGLTPLMYNELSLQAFNKNEGQPRLKSDAAKVHERAPVPGLHQRQNLYKLYDSPEIDDTDQVKNKKDCDQPNPRYPSKQKHVNMNNTGVSSASSALLATATTLLFCLSGALQLRE